MKAPLIFTLALTFPGTLFAEKAVPLLLPSESNVIDAQSSDFNRAISPALATAAKSTVRLWSDSRRLSYGTVVGNGSQILSKWSEILKNRGEIRADTGQDYIPVTLVGVYPDEDLALLEVKGKPLTPVKWSLQPPALGSFIAAPQPDGEMAGFGVVSVLERNLRDTDAAFLGVVTDFNHTGGGVKIQDVAPESGAATAGLKPGQIILKVGSRSISGLPELQNALTGVLPGDSITLLVSDAGSEKTVTVLLGNRPETPEKFGGRLGQMERMGGPISQVRDSFSRAIQTDMRTRPNQVGGPVVDLDGQVIGITMARADRTRSFIMPAAAVVKLLASKPISPQLAQIQGWEKQDSALAQREKSPRPKIMSGEEEDRIRRHISDTERLMQQLREEMKALEEP